MATESQANSLLSSPPPIDLPDEQILTLPDGRKLAYAIYGDASPGAPTVFYFHGFPGSHREALGYAQAARRRGAGATYLGGGRGEADRRAWADEGADATAMREGLVRSTADAMRGDRAGMGAAWEARVLAEPWGFELGELEGGGRGGEAVTFWHGEDDVNVPVHMARRSAELVAGSGLKVYAGEAHLSTALRSADEVLGTLVGLIRKAGE
ncbi:hypothetical protein GGTG_07330 [Gaeumannomyces tritici R3-111a-1]|uniref:Uncharacterized protein n=1 Tax=Gaeumannomyces tritici (strain R3-111a-1) TaxID=644352 RepID=J3P1D3_GAET3|nr:hypothetical protein GGTG_07330 [Gaeumannomyces tritici R3-111a-1]EJT77418.1 hypothetical protein GGTG_07330 [Gaeumannomyces tritici R3-111a-1]